MRHNVRQQPTIFDRDSPSSGRNVLEGMMKRYSMITFGTLAAAFVVLYAGDYVVLRIRVRSGGNAFGFMTVRRYYAVPQKGGKIEFLSADPQQQTCTHSLFPQMGDPPCWYLARHTDQRIDM
jgi:hypothetical protein